MKNTIFYLSTCDTCKRIMGQIDNINQFDLVDIKKSNITTDQLDEVVSSAGLKYEEAFNKRARKYKELEKESLTEDGQYRDLILSEYTFLKRPVIVFEDQVFVGNSKKTVEAMAATVNK